MPDDSPGSPSAVSFDIAGDDRSPEVMPHGGAAMARRALRGTGANLVRLAIHFGQQVLLVPLYLTAWGYGGFGDWLVLTSVSTYLSFADAGVQTYFVNGMTAEWNLGHRRAFHVLFHSALAFLALELLGLGLVLVAVAARVPWRSLFGLSVMDDAGAAAVVVFAGAAMLLAMPAWLVLGVYRCVGEYARSITVVNAVQVVHVLLTAAALALGARPQTIALLLVVPPCSYTAWALLDLHRRYPEIVFGFRYASARVLRRNLAQSGFFVLIPLSQAIWLQGVLLAISVAAGSAAIVAFSVTRTVFLFIRQLLAQITQAASPEITVLFARGELPALSRLHGYLSRLSMVASGAIAGYLAVMCPAIVAWWTSGRVQADAATVWFFAAYTLSAGVWSGSYIFPVSVNRHGGVSVAFLLMSVSTVLLTLLLVPLVGIRGAAIALVLGDAWLVIRVSGITSGLFRGARRDGLAPSLRFGAVAFAAVWIATTITSAAVPGNRPLSVVISAIPAVAAALIVLVAAVPKPDRSAVLHRALGVLEVVAGRAT